MQMHRREPNSIWLDWYAWHPVWPQDDTVFWLETVLRRETPDGHWEYRSFRSELDRQLALTSQALCPGA